MPFALQAINAAYKPLRSLANCLWLDLEGGEIGSQTMPLVQASLPQKVRNGIRGHGQYEDIVWTVLEQTAVKVLDPEQV